MAVNYTCNFNLGECIKTLGLDQQGAVLNAVAEEIKRLSDSYIPFDEGVLKDSGQIVDGEGNSKEIIWDTPYATYMWNGIVYVDPELHCAGFKTENGWRSRKGVQKIPSDRSIQYQNGNLRGPRWVDRMMQEGGREKVEKVARKAVKG